MNHHQTPIMRGRDNIDYLAQSYRRRNPQESLSTVRGLSKCH